MDRIQLARAAAGNTASPARSRDLGGRHARHGDAQSCHCVGRLRSTVRRSSSAGQLAVGLHRAAGVVRQAATQLGQDALDHHAEAATASVLRAGGRRRWCSQPESATAEQAAGQRSRHHSGPSPWHPVSRVECMDEKLSAGPRRRSRAGTHQPHWPVGADLCRPAEVVRRTHPSRNEEPPRRRLRRRRRPVRQPLHRRNDRRGVRAAHLPRAAAKQPRCHHSTAT